MSGRMHEKQKGEKVSAWPKAIRQSSLNFPVYLASLLQPEQMTPIHVAVLSSQIQMSVSSKNTGHTQEKLCLTDYLSFISPKVAAKTNQ